jgi:hypothetical protein
MNVANGRSFDEYNNNCGYNCGSGNVKLDFIDIEGNCNWIHASQANPYEVKGKKEIFLRVFHKFFI